MGDVYIKLLDDLYLCVGQKGMFPGDIGKFFPASNDESKSNKFFAVDEAWGVFERDEKADGLEFDFPLELQGPIIRRIFKGSK